MSVIIDIKKQVENLVDHHKKLERTGKLLFAGWYDRDNTAGDVNLIEVFEEFPDPGMGKLETFQFPSSAEFRMRGSLRITVTSPSELREAKLRNDSTLEHISNAVDGEVIYPTGVNWDYLEGLIN